MLGLMLVGSSGAAESLAAEAASVTNAVNRPATNTPPPRAVSTDLLQFLDGSFVHGRLQSALANKGLAWEHPDARGLIELRPTNIAWIRFEKAKPVAAPSQPGCRFRFSNGDEVFGNVTSIDDDALNLETWFGGRLQAPRRALQQIVFLSKGFSISYEGPTGEEGWVHGKTPHTWQYRDGALIANGAGTLGRDFKLTGSSSLSFDLAWNGHFSLILALYTPVLDRFDYSSSSYMFYLSPGYVTLQRVQGGSGAMNLGQAQIEEMGRKTRLRMEIRANKEDGTLGLLVDDRLVQRWKDSAGFVGQGSGVVFFAQLDGPSIKISNIKVAQWEGQYGMETMTNAPLKDDLVFLVNKDRVTGKVQGLKNGTLSMLVGQASLDIPLSRVSQISLAATNSKPLPRAPWEVRAYFAGGGSVAFDLAKWTASQVSGQSANFGPVGFDSQFIRQLQFNLDRSRPGSETTEILDDVVWDIE
jgi:hypothetical protein